MIVNNIFCIALQMVTITVILVYSWKLGLLCPLKTGVMLDNFHCDGKTPVTRVPPDEFSVAPVVMESC